MRKENFSFIKASIAFISISLLLSYTANAQKVKNTPVPLKTVKLLKTTVTKAQSRTGTCWSFATTSFIETELIRMGKEELDLSEMYFARHAYEAKADSYIRYHGDASFGEGGQAHDVMDVVADYGFVTEEKYHGIMYGEEKHNHRELSRVLKSFVDAVIDARQMTPVWEKAFSSILDTYLGEQPVSLSLNNEELSPKDFAKKLGFNPDDYIELSSYTHHPWYSAFMLEVPDNWSHDLYYNVPVEELMETIRNSIKNGYSVVWDGDVSDDGFKSKKGLAIVPAKDWDDMDEKERDDVFNKLADEKEINQDIRQKAFDDFSATDDHLMHLTGLLRASNGNYYYQTKNSHGKDRNDYDGFVYMSDAYVMLNTLAIMVHKDAIPEKIAEKLGL